MVSQNVTIKETVSLGRIVHVTLTGKAACRPMMVTHAFDPRVVNGVVFLDGVADSEAPLPTGWLTSIPHGPRGTATTWHWPAECG